MCAGPLNAADELFKNEMGLCVMSAAAAYESLQFREALKFSFYELAIKRDLYRQLVEKDKMHKDLLNTWLGRVYGSGFRV